MGEVSQEILNAIRIFKSSAEQIKKLDSNSNKRVFHELLNYFVKSGDRRWWWEDFKQDSFDFVDYEKPFEHLNDIIPDLTKNVWLMIEDDQEDFYPIYDCNPSIIGDIIGECFGFEYYVFDKNKEWVICENHHNRLIGIGQILQEKNIDKIK
ncbi:hypothetical protein GCQ56_14780 [Marinifilum sp. N1E240]|uniref:DUF6756 family protein n=1 Tax=Marinifilum sp. N1E240 TaxID=2608082 RepID=UPI00128BEAF9|nr:DUF6756 family protein [Marinifilum sp. N1E240]MPQ48266.1 hypothetical protein [Marinifilum sp. N1E240]